MKKHPHISGLIPWCKPLVATVLLISLAACSSLGSSGPSSKAIREAAGARVGDSQIQVIQVTDEVARRVVDKTRSALFSEVLGDAPNTETIIGSGDTLEVVIWEAPPAVLFGSTATLGGAPAAGGLGSSTSVSNRSAVPQLMVDDAGNIRIPFAGSIRAAGRTPLQIEREIVNRLSRQAHLPQVSVRVTDNASAQVTVVGDVGTNTRVPLTPKGERLLDVIASSGGVKQPVDKMTIQITRGDQMASLPLARVIRDPAQNIRLQANDVVTALYQPFSFTALGATGTSAEVPFEGTGISLAQALGRFGGLKEDRANAHGVFIFRLEEPASVEPTIAMTARRTPDNRIPVIYSVDLKDPASFFIAQSFPIRDGDVLYVTSAPLTDLQRFIGMISSLAFPLIGLGQTLQ